MSDRFPTKKVQCERQMLQRQDRCNRTRGQIYTIMWMNIQVETRITKEKYTKFNQGYRRSCLGHQKRTGKFNSSF